MPRNARDLRPGHIYHLTHRCHNGSFLLRFANLRNEYRRRLWLAVRRFKILMLNYCITSNHTHLLLLVRNPTVVGVFVQHLDGEFAADFNRRKHRSGAVWGERFHATAIENGRHFWNCMWYIDRNMVRAGVVAHPKEWVWCGYQEIAGLRVRYRVLDFAELLRQAGMIDPGLFADWYCAELGRQLQDGYQRREPHWAESIAVGTEDFVRGFAGAAKNRKRLQIRQGPDASWYVRDPTICYSQDYCHNEHCCGRDSALAAKSAQIHLR